MAMTNSSSALKPGGGRDAGAGRSARRRGWRRNRDVRRSPGPAPERVTVSLGKMKYTRRTGRGNRSGVPLSPPTRAAARTGSPLAAWYGGTRYRSMRLAPVAGRAAVTARIGARLSGICSGSSGVSVSSNVTSAGVIISGAIWSALDRARRAGRQPPGHRDRDGRRW